MHPPEPVGDPLSGIVVHAQRAEVMACRGAHQLRLPVFAAAYGISRIPWTPSSVATCQALAFPPICRRSSVSRAWKLPNTKDRSSAPSDWCTGEKFASPVSSRMQSRPRAAVASALASPAGPEPMISTSVSSLA